MTTIETAPIGQVIRELRKKKNLRLVDLQQRTGIDIAHISRIERGEEGYSERTLKAFSRALDMPISQLFARAEAKMDHRLGDAQFYSCSVSQVPILSPEQILHLAKTGQMPEIKTIELVSVPNPVRAGSYAFSLNSDAMLPLAPAGANVIVEVGIEPQPNNFVLAYIDGPKPYTTFRQMIIEGDHVYLKPANERYPMQPMRPGDRILGVCRTFSAALPA